MQLLNRALFRVTLSQPAPNINLTCYDSPRTPLQWCPRGQRVKQTLDMEGF